MVAAGNVNYRARSDLPERVPIFPLEGALLLPSGQMPLNIFEPRYLAMVDHAMRTERVVGMIQPSFDGMLGENGEPTLCQVGCLGRIVSLSETGDGRYILSLSGIARFRVVEEVRTPEPFRTCVISPFLGDLAEDAGAERVDRENLLRAFRMYLEANQLEADWESVGRASNETLVNALCMMAPYGPREKQALLEAVDLRMRAETLIAITEISLARGPLDEDGGVTLQ